MEVSVNYCDLQQRKRGVQIISEKPDFSSNADKFSQQGRIEDASKMTAASALSLQVVRLD